jgi:Ca2+-binding EF-hand superfamily protein
MAGNHRVTLAKQSFENPMLQADSDEDQEEGSRKLENPMLSEDDGEDISTAQMIAANESEMGETELEDLTYAFEAADLGGEGVITDVEFHTMVHVMGCEMAEEDVRKVIAEAVDGFSSACHLPCL